MVTCPFWQVGALKDVKKAEDVAVGDTIWLVDALSASLGPQTVQAVAHWADRTSPARALPCVALPCLALPCLALCGLALYGRAAHNELRLAVYGRST